MTPFGWPIAFYFVFAMLASGLAGAACYRVVLNTEDRKGVVSALVVALFAVALGALALVYDLERPSEFWYVLVHYNPASWISKGARILAVFSFLLVGLLLLQGQEDMRSGALIISAALSIAALFLALYPALVLAQGLAHPLWQSACIPILFFIGALHVTVTTLDSSIFLELAVVAADIIVFIACVVQFGFATIAASSTAYILLAAAVWGLWIFPSILLFTSAKPWQRLASISLGAFGLRGLILYSGQVI